MSVFLIASLQLELGQGDNIDEIAEEMRLAKRRMPAIGMFVIGELAAFGVRLEYAQAMPGPAEDRFCALARELGVWVLPGSLYERDGEKIYNTAPVINPDGEVVSRYRKMYPFLPYERDVAPGADFCVFDVPEIGRFGVSICYDMWFPETSRTLAWMGAEVILHVVQTNTIDRDVELAMARATAAQNQAYIIDVNVAGRLGMGRSIMVGPGGEVLHQAGAEREIIPIELDLAYVRRVRESGWHGLGQVLKSFRDGPGTFPPYQAGASAAALERLGPLEKQGPRESLSGSKKTPKKKSGG